MPIADLLVGGILLGGVYALMACGLNLIFGVMRVINFAHGDILAIAALSTVSIAVGLKLPFWVAVLVVPIGCAAFGALIHLVILRRIEGAPLIMSLLATYALSTILVNVAILVWGGGYSGLPGVLTGSLRILGINVSISRLVSFACAIGVSLAVWWVLEYTRFGRAVRSVSAAPELASISGIAIERVRLATFALGTAMAGFAGVLVAPAFAIDPQLGSRFIIKAFAVIIVGGMGSYPGAILAALLLGVIEVVGSYLAGAVIGSAFLFLLMLAVLLLRPRGLLGCEHTDMKGLNPLAVIGMAAVIAVVIPLVGSDYAISFSIQLLIFLVLAYSWNWIGGYAGYTHFGQVGFFGIGAYVGSLLNFHYGVPWHLAAIAAAGAGAIAALPLGGAMLRLKGPFFAIGMFGLARVLEAFALGFDSITGGGTGIYLKPVSDLKPIYYAVAAVALIMSLLTWKLDNSRLGLKLLAIREDESAAESLGIPTTRLKIGTFVASAVAPAAMGSIYAVYLGFIDPPTAFAPNVELTTIAMVLLGGMGTVLGPLAGALVLSVVNEVLWANYPQIYLACVGVIVLLAVLFMPRGIVNLGMKSGWLKIGRPSFRSLAIRTREASP